MKGTQRKVMYFKNTGSPMFEEAYFVIREGADKIAQSTEEDFIKEANRIINESTRKTQKENKLFLNSALIFLSGFISSALIMLILIFT